MHWFLFGGLVWIAVILAICLVVRALDKSGFLDESAPSPESLRDWERKNERR